MKPILTVAETRAADALAIASVGEEMLIERAGAALARQVVSALGGSYGRRAVVVAGRGNNGADGRVAARRLAQSGMAVSVFPAADAPEQLPGADVVIDAAYGTGFRGEYTAPRPPAGALVVAADIPSGVSGDSGESCEQAVVADLTVTFSALKPGLVQGAGRQHAGRVIVADIGIPAAGYRASLVEDADLASELPPRPASAHKWSAAVGVVAGSPGMIGAARLCGESAQRAGAGMVRLGLRGVAPADLPSGDAVAIALPGGPGWAQAWSPEMGRLAALVIGPGLGRDADCAAGVRALVAEAPCPVVVDADGLWALGSAAEAASALAGRHHPVVLTPHDGEYARMAGSPPGADVMAAARSLAASTTAVVLLKGPTTVVASPDGSALVVTSGSARLATPGSGDVLSGMIGAFLARGVAAPLAAALAAHLHGRAAGDGLAEGLIASDLPLLVARRLSTLRTSQGPTQGPRLGHG